MLCSVEPTGRSLSLSLSLCGAFHQESILLVVVTVRMCAFLLHSSGSKRQDPNSRGECWCSTVVVFHFPFCSFPANGMSSVSLSDVPLAEIGCEFDCHENACGSFAVHTARDDMTPRLRSPTQYQHPRAVRDGSPARCSCFPFLIPNIARFPLATTELAALVAKEGSPAS